VQEGKSNEVRDRVRIRVGEGNRGVRENLGRQNRVKLVIFG